MKQWALCCNAARMSIAVRKCWWLCLHPLSNASMSRRAGSRNRNRARAEKNRKASIENKISTFPPIRFSADVSDPCPFLPPPAPLPQILKTTNERTIQNLRADPRINNPQIVSKTDMYFCTHCNVQCHRSNWDGHLQSRAHYWYTVTRQKLFAEGVAALPPPGVELMFRHVWCSVCERTVGVEGPRDDIEKWRFHVNGKEHQKALQRKQKEKFDRELAMQQVEPKGSKKSLNIDST